MIMLFEQLWNGQIAPHKNCGVNDPEVQELVALCEKNQAELKRALSEEQNTLLNRYICCNDDYLYLMSVHAFRKGFCLASRFLAEAMSEQMQGS